MPRAILVSACLLGLATRYDGKSKLNNQVMEYLRQNDLTPIPVCPEQLAGLPTPRPKSFFCRGTGNEVLDGGGALVSSGVEVNAFFIKGAQETLKIAGLTGCREALLKERSPSCGVHQVYRNSQIVRGAGVTTALLLRHELKIISEEDL